MSKLFHLFTMDSSVSQFSCNPATLFIPPSCNLSWKTPDHLWMTKSLIDADVVFRNRLQTPFIKTGVEPIKCQPINRTSRSSRVSKMFLLTVSNAPERSMRENQKDIMTVVCCHKNVIQHPHMNSFIAVNGPKNRLRNIEDLVISKVSQRLWVKSFLYDCQ